MDTPKFSDPAEISLQLRAQLRDLARDIAHEAGALVKEIRRGHVDVAATKSTDTDVVTVADTMAEKLVRELLAKHRPDDGILGEEDEAVATRTGLTWVVDPIDGTVNYVHNLSEYSVSIAVVLGPANPAQWQVIAGCVYRPDDGESFEAALELGSHHNGERMRVAESVELGQALIATGFGYDAAVRREQGRVLAGVIPHIADIRRFGSAALDLSNLAAGKFDAFYESGLNPWDMAAGELMISEAGGVVTGLNGKAAGPALTVAGSPKTAADLANLLASLDAERVLE